MNKQKNQNTDQQKQVGFILSALTRLLPGTKMFIHFPGGVLFYQDK